MITAMVSHSIATLQPSGFVSASNATEVQIELTQVVVTSPQSILVVDMKQVEFMDSAGLMVFVNAFKLAQSLGRRFILCSLAPSVRMLFEITQLDKVFEIFETHDAISVLSY